MKIIKPGRQTGRTTRLIEKCVKNNGVIITNDIANRDAVRCKARDMGYTLHVDVCDSGSVPLPRVMAATELLPLLPTNDVFDKDFPVYIDNAEQVFSILLRNFTGTTPVKEIVGFGDYWNDKKLLKKKVVYHNPTPMSYDGRKRTYIKYLEDRLKHHPEFHSITNRLDTINYLVRFNNCAIGISFVPIHKNIHKYPSLDYGHNPIHWTYIDVDESTPKEVLKKILSVVKAIDALGINEDYVPNN